MRKSILLPCLLALLVFSAYASPTKADDSALFKIYGSTPVVNHGASGTWNFTYTDPGAIVFHDGLFHMFYNGFNGWPAPVQIGYATSPDGYTWTKQGDVPVLETKQVSYAKVAALASSVIVDKDGTWVMYFYTYEGYLSPGSPGRIGRATAAKPTGPWTVDSTPVLEPGGAGTWDEQRVDVPSVIRTDTGYVMYYGGSDAKNNLMIGMATSTDGINWTKYKDTSPASDTRFAESTPILRAGEKGSWDANLVHQPRVVLTPDGWVMLYRTVKFGTPSTIALGYATSTDGKSWTKATGNPILKASEILSKRGFWFTGLAYNAGKYYLYVEAPPLTEPSHTAVFVAIHDGPLPK